MKISFATNVYYKSWQTVLLRGFLENQLNFLNYDFHEKFITINNLDNKAEVIDIIQTKFPDFKIIIVDKEYRKALESFNLIDKDLGGSHNYSLQHYSLFHLTESDYLLYICEDCPIQKYDTTFIPEAVEIMEKDDRFLCATLSWDKDSAGAKAEALYDIGNFYGALGFSDHLYLAKMSIFKQDIYHYNHQASSRYPGYAGISFERKIDSYMQTELKYRLIHKNSHYHHSPIR